MAAPTPTLTEKMKHFCREYYTNGGNATEAYLVAYNTTSRITASRESYVLLKRPDVNEYLKELNLPNENKAISEREKKRDILWSFINDTTKSDNDRLKAMDLLNKMDSEYVNINRNIDENKTDISNLDSDTLARIAKAI